MIERPLKILMTDPHLMGGGQVCYVANLANELTRRGHRVIVGCQENSVLLRHAREAGCECLNTFRFRGGLRPRTWANDLRAVSQFIRTEKPDVLAVNGSQDHWTCALGNRLLGSPVCVVRTRHNTYRVHDAWPNRVLNRKWTDYQIVVCNVVRRQLAAQRAFDGDRMCSIHNGVDTEFFKPDPDAREAIRAEFGYSDEDLVFGIAARLVEAKGHCFLFEAAQKLLPEFPNLRILALGRGDLEPALKAMAERLGLGNIVTFGGFRDDIVRCIQAFDVGVLPSIDCDTSSFSLKEQMAAEKPVISSDHGGLTEILTDGEEGIVVPAGTVQELANALRALLKSPELRTRMGKAGRKRVINEFSLEGFASKTVEAYHTAMEIHRERSSH